MRGSWAIIWIMLLLSVRLDAIDNTYFYRSALFSGRGGAGLAVAEGEDALFYNPGGLGFGEGLFKKIVFASPMVEFSSGFRELYNEIVLREKDPTKSFKKQIGKPQHLGANMFSGVVLRKVALGVFSCGAGYFASKGWS